MMHEANRTNKSFVGLEGASEQCETVNSLSEGGNYEVGKIILEEQLKYLECLRNKTEEPVPWKNNKVVQKYLCDLQVRELPLFHIMSFAPVDDRHCVRVDVVRVGEIWNIDQRDLFDR